MAEGREPVSQEDPIYRPVPQDEPARARAGMPELSLEARGGNFEEVELGYDAESGRSEAGARAAADGGRLADNPAQALRPTGRRACRGRLRLPTSRR